MLAKNSFEDLLIEPIIIVCNMFLDQLNDLERRYDDELPKRVRNLLENLEDLIKSYEEGENAV